MINLAKKKYFEVKGYVKCNLNQYLMNCLDRIHKDIGTPKSDIVRIALYQFFKSNYPDLLKENY